jgi:multiple sugar transport system permease protein
MIKILNSTFPIKKKYILFLILITPVFILRFSTAAYPILDTFFLSFTNLHLIDGTNDFVGLENYRVLFDHYNFKSALSFTIMFVVASTILELVLGLLIALLLNAKFRGKTFARTINLIPWAIPTIVAAYAFRWILDDQFGIFSHAVSQITGENLAILNSALGAQFSTILVNVWKNAPFMGIIFLAGLQSVPDELYEAAKVDGANALQRFWRITLPIISPLVITMSMYLIVWQLASFDLIYGFTRGGPGVATNVLAFYIFQEGFLFFKFGYASAISMILLIFVALVGLLGIIWFRRSEY